MLTRDVELLQQTPLFNRLPVQRLKLLAYGGQKLTYKAGDCLFRFGDASDAAFVILTGEVEATVPGPEEDTIIGHFGPLELIGEIGIFTGNVRSVTMRAKSTATVLRIPGHLLTELVHDCPACATSITTFMAEVVERLVNRVAVTSHH